MQNASHPKNVSVLENVFGRIIPLYGFAAKVAIPIAAARKSILTFVLHLPYI